MQIKKTPKKKGSDGLGAPSKSRRDFLWWGSGVLLLTWIGSKFFPILKSSTSKSKNQVVEGKIGFASNGADTFKVEVAKPLVHENLEFNKKDVLQISDNIKQKNGFKPMIKKLQLTNEEWKKRLEPLQYKVLREEGTERPFTSLLNDEKREGYYHCAGCDLRLFTSEMKFDSGTGWPSFFTCIPHRFETKSDFVLIYKRTEYHCTSCGGHHGHVFNDGPKPTGQRWCNNGVALKFVAGKITEEKTNST